MLLPFSFFSLSAQDIADGDDENSVSSEYWDKHFAFHFGFSSTMGLGAEDYRRYTYANLSWKHDFDWIAFAFEAEAYRREYQYILESNSEPDSEIAFATREKNVIYREANVKLSPSDLFQLSLGYHTVVWGQVSGFSPIDYIMPRRSATGSISLSKSNGRLPQASAILSIFPHPQIEIQGYYFPYLTIDDATRRFFTTVNSATQKEGANNRLVEDLADFQFPNEKDAAQYAGRLLFYFDWMTLGFTYYESWSFFDPKENKRIKVIPISSSTSYYRIIDEPTLARVQNYSFEMSIPLGSWNVAFDGLRRIRSNSISINDIDEENKRLLGETIFSHPATPIRQALVDFVLARKDKGSLDYDFLETILALELALDTPTWRLGFGLVNIMVEDVDEDATQLQKLEKELDEADGKTTSDEGLAIAPFLNIGRYLSEDKKDIVGFSAGLFGSIGFGAIIYWASEFFEALEVSLSLEVLQLFSTDEVIDAFEDTEPKNLIFPALRITASYKF